MGDKKPGASCSSWCTVRKNSNVFCAKRNGKKLCYIKEGYDAGNTPEFCTVPHHTTADGKCGGKKGLDESCNEDSNCGGSSLKCSASLSVCKHSSLGLAPELRPSCSGDVKKGPRSLTASKQLPELTPDTCPHCCRNSTAVEGCCLHVQKIDVGPRSYYKGCSMTLDDKCIDGKCSLDLGRWVCAATDGNVGEL